MEADLGVLGVRDEPVDRGEVLPLCQLLVQAPKHLQGHRHTLKQCVGTEMQTGQYRKARSQTDSVWHQAAQYMHCVRPDVHATQVFFFENLKNFVFGTFSSKSSSQAEVLTSHDQRALWHFHLMTVHSLRLCTHM